MKRSLTNIRILAMLIMVLSVFIYISRWNSQSFEMIESHSSVSAIVPEKLDHRVLLYKGESITSNSVYDSIENLKALPKAMDFNKFGIKKHNDYDITGGRVAHLLSVPVNLQDLDATSALLLNLPLYRYKHSKIYVNGNFYQEVTGGGFALSELNLYIDRNRPIQNIEILIDAEYGPESSGSISIAPALIGKASVVGEHSLALEREDHTFPLLFFSFKLGLFVVLGILYFFVSRKQRLQLFLFVAFFQIIEPLMIGTWFKEYFLVRERVLIFFLCQSFSFHFLKDFFIELSGRKQKHSSILYTLSSLPVLIGIGLSYSYYFNIGKLSIGDLFFSVGILNFINLIVPFGVFSKKAFRKRITKEQILIYATLAVYASFYLINNVLGKRQGNDLRFFMDISLFIFTAVVTLKEFITLRQTLSKQKRELANKNLDSLIGSQAAKVSHDLRRPLSAMKCFIEDYELLSESEKIERMELLTKSIYFGEKQIDSILDEKRKLKLDLEAVEINSWLKSLLAKLEFENSRFDFQLKVEGIKAQQVYIEKAAYEAVVQNIFVNALEATASQKERAIIRIGFKTLDNRVLALLIENNGPHIPSASLVRLFDIGFTEGKRNGTGIGLSASYEAVGKHGYELKVRNTDFGVCFEVPLGIPSQLSSNAVLSKEKDSSGLFKESNSRIEVELENQRAAMTEHKVTNFSLSVAKVYLIDDDPLIAMSWKLKWKGTNKLVIYNKPSEFLKEIEDSKIKLNTTDLVISDYHFENETDYNGLMLKELLETEYQFSRCILNTGDQSISINSVIPSLKEKSTLSPDELLKSLDTIF